MSENKFFTREQAVDLAEKVTGFVKARTYDKDETDALLADKAASDDVYTKTEADELLAEKADAADTYTKTEIDDTFLPSYNFTIEVQVNNDVLNVEDIHIQIDKQRYINNTIRTIEEIENDGLEASDTNQQLYNYLVDNILSGHWYHNDILYFTKTTGTTVEGDTLSTKFELSFMGANAPKKRGVVYIMFPSDEIVSGFLRIDNTGLITQYLSYPNKINSKIDAKQDALTFDDIPTENSTNPVTSGGVYTALSDKANSSTVYTKSETDDLLNDKQDTLTFDNVPTNESENPVTSEGIYEDIHTKVIKDTEAAVVKTLTTASLPLNTLKVGIDAVQDLHGYTKPWAGGANVNLLDLETKAETTSAGITSQIYEDNRIVVSGTSGGNGDIIMSFAEEIALSANQSYTLSLNGTDTRSGSLYIFTAPNYAYWGIGSINNSTHSITYTPTEDRTITGLIFRTSNGNSFNGDFRLQIEKGSTATSYSPYSNICPISGWDEVNVTRCGKNLLPSMPYPYEAKTLIDYGQDITLNGYTLSFVFSGSFLHETAAFLMFRMSDGSLSTSATAIKFYRKVSDNTYITANTTYTNEPIYLSSTGSITFRKIVIYNYPIFTDAKFENAQLEEGSTATTYEPYTGQTYTKSLSTTSYGGYWDATEGVIGTEYGYLEYDGSDDEEWTRSVVSDGYNFFNIALDTKAYLTSNMPLMCNRLNHTYISNNTDIGIYNVTNAIRVRYAQSSDLTTADFRAWLSENPLQVKYPLATPTTATTTPEEIPLSQGTNNLWADSGNIEEVEFYASNNAANELLSQVNDLLEDKADSDNVYTKAEIDAMIGNISSTLDAINREVI